MGPDDPVERDDLAYAGAVRQAELIRRGEVSSRELVELYLERIERLEPELNAFRTVMAERALADARQADARRDAGGDRPLLGVPLAVKDSEDVVGEATAWGTAAQTGVAQGDSDLVSRLRAAGAVILGKTNLPELAIMGSTEGPAFGVTRNPWSTDRTPGGSSGGSAAAVAAGMGELSVGTDAGGSVRIPASFCGVVGLKPTHGRIPLFPASPFGALAHAGPLGRSVDDVALLMDVLAQPDPRDPSALAPLTGTFAEAVRRDVRGVRAAFSPTLGYVDVDPEIADLTAAAVQVIQDSGIQVEQADPGFVDPSDAFEVLWACGAAKWLSTFPEGSREKVDPGLGEIWDQGLTISALEYLAANETRAALGILMGGFHTSYDVLITPMMPVRPFEAGHDVPPGGPYTKWWQWTRFSYPFNLTPQPAISVPIGRTSDGLPAGLHIVGPRHADDLVLAVARHVEQTLAR